MKLSREVRNQFRRCGRAGGEARAERLSSNQRTAIARQAAVRRWTRVRFGDSRFESLGLPGGALIDKGLDDLAAGRETVESLAVALAAPRLRRDGVPVPNVRIEDPDWRLYRLLERDRGVLAHARYLAYLRQVASFADSCGMALLNRDRSCEKT